MLCRFMGYKQNTVSTAIRFLIRFLSLQQAQKYRGVLKCAAIRRIFKIPFLTSWEKFFFVVKPKKKLMLNASGKIDFLIILRVRWHQTYFRTAGSQIKSFSWVRLYQQSDARMEPGTPRWEAQTLPLSRSPYWYLDGWCKRASLCTSRLPI